MSKEMNKDNKEKKDNIMQAINEYAGSYRHLITFGRLLAAASAFVGMVPYYILWKIIRIAVENGDTSEITGLAWKAFGVMVCSMIMYVAALMCTHVSAFRVQAAMRSRLMRHVIELPLGVFDREGTGKIRRIVSDSSAATETYIAHNLSDKAVAAATPIGLIVLMLAFDWRIGLICLIPAVLGFILLMVLMGKETQRKMTEYQNSLEVMSNEATEYVRGIPVVKTFGQTVSSFRRFKRALDDYEKWCIDYTVSMRKSMIGFITGINTVFAALVCSAYMFSGDGVTDKLILNMMYYIIITPLLTVALTKTAYSGEQAMKVTDSIKRIDGILNMKKYDDVQKNHAGADKNLTDHSIELDHVSYRYADATGDAVHDLSLKIEQGQHVALVGPSGGGKSTTAALIARFFDVTEGTIRIGGVDVRDISQESLMEMVSFVFQDSRLIKGTILDNVRMAKPEASESEVMAALEKAQCMDIIEKQPNGIHTVIGSAGTYLSGGEQQRIAIARAFLKDAPILIVDEATAFADPDNEVMVQRAFEALSEGRTLIMIAHRLTTVMDADRIFVLKDGMCAESGRHEELMVENGIYSQMYDEYIKSVDWKVGA